MKISEEYEGVCVFAEQNEGEIHPVSFELLGKGRELADELDTFLSTIFLTSDGSDVEELIYRGADKVYHCENSVFGEPKEIIFKENIVQVIKKEKPEIFLIGATNFGRSLAPRVAASLKNGLTADCTGLEISEEGKLVQIRPAFTGNVLAHILSSTLPQMSTVRYGEFDEPDRESDRSGEVIEIDPQLDVGRDIEILEKLEVEEVNLEEANIIVSGGRGLKDPNDFDLLRDFADLLGGKLGCSRPIVDEGWIEREHQVGYSGKRVKPEVYIACGISGAPQHLAGMKKSDVIIGINSDPSAPIFEVADYGIVGDLYEVVPMLADRIKGGVED